MLARKVYEIIIQRKIHDQIKSEEQKLKLNQFMLKLQGHSNGNKSQSNNWSNPYWEVDESSEGNLSDCGGVVEGPRGQREQEVPRIGGVRGESDSTAIARQLHQLNGDQLVCNRGNTHH